MLPTADRFTRGALFVPLWVMMAFCPFKPAFSVVFGVPYAILLIHLAVKYRKQPGELLRNRYATLYGIYFFLFNAAMLIREFMIQTPGSDQEIVPLIALLTLAMLAAFGVVLAALYLAGARKLRERYRKST